MSGLEIIRKEYITTKDFAKALNLTYGRIVQLIHEGQIHAEKFGRDWVIKRTEFERFKKAAKKSPGRSTDKVLE